MSAFRRWCGFLNVSQGRADRDNAPIASLGDGRVNDNQNNRDNDNDNIGLRPAVEILNKLP